MKSAKQIAFEKIGELLDEAADLCIDAGIELLAVADLAESKDETELCYLTVFGKGGNYTSAELNLINKLLESTHHEMAEYDLASEIFQQKQ